MFAGLFNFRDNEIFIIDDIKESEFKDIPFEKILSKLKITPYVYYTLFLKKSGEEYVLAKIDEGEYLLEIETFKHADILTAEFFIKETKMQLELNISYELKDDGMILFASFIDDIGLQEELKKDNVKKVSFLDENFFVLDEIVRDDFCNPKIFIEHLVALERIEILIDNARKESQ